MKKKISLARLLSRYSSEEARYSSEFGDDIHVSDLFTLCPREYHLVKKLKITKGRIVAPGTRMSWEWGKAVEAVIVRWLEENDMVQDKQVDLKHEKLGIVGHADIRLKDGSLVEVKAKDPNIFRLTRYKPLPRDLFQLQCYLWLDKTKTGTLLAATFGQEKVPYRETEVHYNLQVPELIKRKSIQFERRKLAGKCPHGYVAAGRIGEQWYAQ